MQCRIHDCEQRNRLCYMFAWFLLDIQWRLLGYGSFFLLFSLTLTFYIVCQLGCTQCADGTGDCTACKSGFSQDTNDPTKCNPPQSITTTGQTCPVGSFSTGSACSPCSSSCQTCTGGTSSDCIICATGLFTSNGACVSANSNGVCQGSGLIADNNKRECDGKSHCSNFII